MRPGVGVYGIDDSRKSYIKKLKDKYFHVVGLCGQEIESARALGEEFQVDFTTTKVEDLLLNKDRIPDFCEHVCKSLAVAGKHVLCLDGFCSNYQQARQMYDASLKYSTLLSVIENPLNYGRNIQLTKNLLSKNYVGDILYIDAVITSSSIWNDESYLYEVNWGGGLFQRYGIWVVDVICKIMSMTISKINCHFHTQKLYPNTKKVLQRNNSDDYFNFFSRFHNGVPLSIRGRVDHKIPYEFYRHTIKIVGSKGEILIDNDALEVKMHEDLIEFDPLYSSQSSTPTLFTFPPVNSDHFSQLLDELEQIFSKGKYNPDKNSIKELVNFEKGLYLSTIIEAAIVSDRLSIAVHLNEIINSHGQVHKSEANLPQSKITRIESSRGALQSLQRQVGQSLELYSANA